MTMQGGTMRACRVWVVVGLLVLMAGASQAQYVSDENKDRWLPNLTPYFAVHSQSMDVSGVSSLGWQAGQNTNVLTSLFGTEGGVATPVLIDRFGSPRLFGSVGFQVPMSNEYPVLNRRASFDTFNPVTDQVCPVGVIVQTCDQTLKLTMNLNVNWTINAGLDFTLPVFERKLYVRTGLQYLGQSVDFEGFAERVDRGSGTAGQNAPGVPVAETLICCATDSATLHALGPSLALNADAARLGPIALHVFAQVNTFWYVSNDPIEFGAVRPNGEVQFSVRPSPFVGQGLAGVRIVWEGK
jgi:hypothetical protein